MDQRVDVVFRFGPGECEAIELSPGRFSVGRGLGSDILLGPVSLDTCFHLAVNVNGTLAVEPASPDVTVAPAALAQRIREPLALDMVCVDLPGQRMWIYTKASRETAWRDKGRRLLRTLPPVARPRQAAAVAVCGFALVAVLAAWAGKARTAPLPKAAHTVAALASETDVQAALRERFKRLSLPAMVSTDHTGGLIISGELNDGQALIMQDLADAVRARHRIPVSLQLRSSSEQVAMGVQLVSLGARPVAIFQNGQRGTIGSIVYNGWSIASISRDTVVLRKQDDTRTIRF